MQLHNPRAAILAVALLVAVGATHALADGSHKQKAKIRNDIGFRIRVEIFDGDDHCEGRFHLQKVIQEGNNEPIKCHPRGKDRCSIKIFKATDYERQGKGCYRIRGNCALTLNSNGNYIDATSSGGPECEFW